MKLCTTQSLGLNSLAFSAELLTTLLGTENFLVPNYSSSSAKPAWENRVCIAVPVEHMKLSGLFQTQALLAEKGLKKYMACTTGPYC